MAISAISRERGIHMVASDGIEPPPAFSGGLKSYQT